MSARKTHFLPGHQRTPAERCRIHALAMSRGFDSFCATVCRWLKGL